jgi:hypothetical protein
MVRFSRDTVTTASVLSNAQIDELLEDGTFNSRFLAALLFESRVLGCFFSNDRRLGRPFKVLSLATQVSIHLLLVVAALEIHDSIDLTDN